MEESSKMFSSFLLKIKKQTVKIPVSESVYRIDESDFHIIRTLTNGSVVKVT